MTRICLDGTTWARHVIDAEATDSHTLVTADVDGRGRDVIIVGQRQGKRSVCLYAARDEDGLEWEKEVLDEGPTPASGCDVADLNGDKRVDVVCISAAELKWYENVGAAATASTQSPASRAPRQ